jgi:hypothetical protein
MRKLLFIMAGAIIAIGMVSCEKKGGIPNSDMGLGNDGIVKGQPITVVTDSDPVSFGGSVPYLIPGENRGGNRTCDEAKDAFFDLFGRDLEDTDDCGEKVDIDDDYVGFVGAFPFEVEILEDGTMRFDTGDPECKVFAVIVKGSNHANVYFYEEGAVSDGGLTPPPFDPEADPLRFPWISNITFCCVCDVPEEPEEEVIAIKVYHSQGYALSVADEQDGSYPWALLSGWCADLGVNAYPDVSPIAIGTVGTAVVAEGSVTITLDEALEITNVAMYLGEEPVSPGDCPSLSYPYPWKEFPGDGNHDLVITWTTW